MYWIDTSTEEEAAQVHFGMWDSQWHETEGGQIIGKSPGPTEGDEFWTDVLDRVKDQPDERIAVATRQLPINAAWREISIGLRAKIRDSRKSGSDFEGDLEALHHLAALHSFGFEEVRGRGYDFMALIPYARLAKLDLSYQLLGCDALPLLSLTDRKWIREKWGKPVQHTTARALNLELYASETKRIAALQERHREESIDRAMRQIDEIDRAVKRAHTEPRPRTKPVQQSSPTGGGVINFVRGLIKGILRT